jgi:hypothetical protein
MGFDTHAPGDPVCCPSCAQALIVTCPNACANAALGAHADVDPIATVPAPRGPRAPRTKKSGGGGTAGGSSICSNCQTPFVWGTGRAPRLGPCCETPERRAKRIAGREKQRQLWARLREARLNDAS